MLNRVLSATTESFVPMKPAQEEGKKSKRGRNSPKTTSHMLEEFKESSKNSRQTEGQKSMKFEVQLTEYSQKQGLQSKTTTASESQRQKKKKQA